MKRSKTAIRAIVLLAVLFGGILCLKVVRTHFGSVLITPELQSQIEKGMSETDAKELADGQIERFVTQLGNESYREREAASQSLAMLGEPALERLRRAASSSEDLEVRWRASNAIAQIEQGLVKRQVRELTESNLDRNEKSKRLRKFIRPGMAKAYVDELFGFPRFGFGGFAEMTWLYEAGGYFISFDRYGSVLRVEVSEEDNPNLKPRQTSDNTPQKQPSEK